MSNPSVWNQILRIEPDAIAYAVDRAGMQSCFTEACYYHEAAGKWIPAGSEKAKRVNLGLLNGLSSHFEPAGSLEIMEGKEEAFQLALSEGRVQTKSGVKDVATPAEHAAALAKKAAKAKEAEEVFAATTVAPADKPTDEFIAENSHIGVTEVGASTGSAETPSAELPTATPRSAEVVLAEHTTLLHLLADMVFAIGDVMPKTKKAKIQDQLNKLAKVFDNA